MASREEQLGSAQKALQAGDFARGLQIVEALLQADPGDGEALYIAAVAARYLGRFEQADEHLARLHTAMPEYGRAWQETGHLARACQMACFLPRTSVFGHGGVKPRKMLIGLLEPSEIPRSYCGDVKCFAVARIGL